MTRGLPGERGTRSDRLRVFSCLLGAAALFGGASAHASIDFAFLQRGALLSASKPAYWRYEMVELRAQAQGSLSPGRQPVLEARFFRHGQPLPGLPGRDACLLRWDANTQAWAGRWPIPFNPILGDVEARLAVPAEAGQGDLHVQALAAGQRSELWVKPGQWLASCHFEIRGRKPYPVPKGFGVMTLEPGANRYRFRDPDGRADRPQGIDRLFDWARFMEADAFWHCGVQTQVWSDKREETWPWSKEHLDQVWVLAAKAKREGIPYGAYMLTFLVGGDYQKPGAAVKTAAYSSDSGSSWLLAQTPPHGFRSAVAYDADSKTWITVGPNGTDISTDDGRNWRALKPDPKFGDAPEADQHWNALSLPFVVGPHGRIGILRPDALRTASDVKAAKP